jgi:hypothetical protein
MARVLRAAILIACFLYAGRVFAAGGTCPSGADYPSPTTFGPNVTLADLGITNCYFVAANGSDSNSGTSESSPWAHLPGMPACTGNCKAVTPTGGTGFILRGGDTWNNSNFPINWQWAGSSGNPIYIGNDPNWSSGGSSARPIWNGGGTSAYAGNMLTIKTKPGNVIVDNIEVTGLYSSATSGSGPNYLSICTSNVTMERIYAHGWVHNSGATQNISAQVFSEGCGTNVSGSVIRYNIADGSDTSQDFMMFAYSAIPIAYGNYMYKVQTGIDGCGDNWHDNMVDTLVQPVSGAAHQDGLYHMTPCGYQNGLVTIYNNVVRNITWSGSGGAVKFWLNGNGGFPSNVTAGYAFNNVIYNNVPGNTFDTGRSNAGSVNYGTWYIFNNTVACGTDSEPGVCQIGTKTSGNPMTLHLSNNHWISTGSVLTCSSPCVATQTDDLTQTVSQASAQGYSDSTAYAYEPTSASGATVTQTLTAALASTRQSVCTAIGAVDTAAGAACQSDTTYACAYEQGSHTLQCPAKQTVARAADPNVGAYQFSSVQATTPNPPAGLVVSVQ